MPQTMTAWLKTLGLGQYADAFAENAIELDVLADLSDEDLEKIGVRLGHRRKILKAIAQEQPLVARATASKPAKARPGEAERRHLTVLFCDLVGSTALSARHDPEDMREMIRAFQDCCAGVVARYDGFVAKFMGDGVLVYFGYPRAHEGDAERAVRAGLDMSAAVERLRAPDGTELRARIGIASGLVVVGDLVGEGPNREHAAIGDALNLAARLQQLAEPGTVVIAEPTRQRLGRRFAFRDLGSHTVKGLAEPVAACTVAGVARFDTRFEFERDAGLSPYVGREREVALLDACWAAACQGSTRSLLISGEAGIGKSRLIFQFARNLPAGGHILLRYQCSPFHQSSALYPFTEQIRQTAGIEEGGAPALQLDRLEALIGASISKSASARLAPLLADLLSIPADGRYPPLGQSAAQRRRHTLDAFLAQLESQARQQPVVVFFEDMHWADATTLEVVTLWIKRIRDLPVLLLMTCRPEFVSPWRHMAEVGTTTLRRLDADSVRTLIASLSGGAPLPRQVAERIAVNTDGVPLFIEELTKTVRESGFRPEHAEHGRMQGFASDLGIPVTLQDSLMARLDRLAPVRDVAQTAAAIGREFSFEVLQAVAGRNTSILARALARLEDSGLLFRVSPPPNSRYRFKHSLVQTAAYETLLRSRRVFLHARIAKALSELFPTIAATEPETIAYHLSRAGQPAAAAHWWSKAGQHAQQRSAHIEAIAHYSHAIAMADTPGETPLPAAERLRLQMEYAHALVAVHSHGAPVTVAAFARARELAAEIAEPAERFAVYYGLWAGSHVRGELVPAREIAAAFVAEVEHGPVMPEAGLAYRALGTTYWTMGELALARTHLKKALGIHDAERDRSLCLRHNLDPGVGTMMQLAIVQWQMGEVSEAVAIADGGLQAALRTAHTPTIAYAHGWRALLETLRANAKRSIVNAHALVDLSHVHALSVWDALGTMFHGWAVAQTSGETSSLDAMRAVIDSFRDGGLLLYQTFFPALLAEVEAVAGNVDAAVALIEEARTVGEATGQRWYIAELHRQRASLALRRPAEGFAVAEAHLERAAATARAQQATSFERRAALLLATLRGRSGPASTSAESAEVLRATFDEETCVLEIGLVART
jgi:class 3 adenylate cyclase/predicted ATPase